MKMIKTVCSLLGVEATWQEAELRHALTAWQTFLEHLEPCAASDVSLQELRALTHLRLGAALALLREGHQAQEHLCWLREQPVGNEVPRLLAALLEGGIALERGEHEEAMARWTHVIEAGETCHLDAQSLGLTYLLRAMLYGDQHRYQEALADCEQAAQFLPEEAEVYAVRGLTFAYLGEFERGLRDCTQAVERHPCARCYQRRGVVYRLHRDYPRALQDFEAALALEPRNAQLQQACQETRVLQALDVLTSSLA